MCVQNSCSLRFHNLCLKNNCTATYLRWNRIKCIIHKQHVLTTACLVSHSKIYQNSKYVVRLTCKCWKFLSILQFLYVNNRLRKNERNYTLVDVVTNRVVKIFTSKKIYTLMRGTVIRDVLSFYTDCTLHRFMC